jgi:methylated-DNA-[protein]-cysteine S-methyltransferase
VVRSNKSVFNGYLHQKRLIIRNKDMKLYYTTLETSFGWLLLVGSNGKLVELKLPKPTKEAALAGVPSGAVESIKEFGDLIERLRLYFDGKPVDFSDIPVSFEGLGEFHAQVLRETMKIGYGDTISYGELAAIAGSPGAARAVGNAMHNNPMAIVVPCHRVLHKNGLLGGYAGGLDLKRRLLTMEGANI